MTTNKNLIHWANLLYLLIVVTSLLTAGNPANAPTSRPTWLDPAAGTIAMQVLLILIPALAFVWITRQPFCETFKLKRLAFRTSIKCFLIGLACWAVFIFLSNLSQALLALISPARTGSPADIATSGGAPWLVFVGVALVAPFCEEALNRGVLLSAYEPRTGFLSVGLVGILFALLHPSLDQVLGALFVGTVAGWVVYRTRSIWAGFLVHVGTNLLSSVLTLFMALALPNGAEGAAQEAAQVGDPSALLWTGSLVWGGISLVMFVPLFFLIRNVGKTYPGPEWPEANLGLNGLKPTWA
jgi:membrane protease YdiL (CAAX protease family)